MNQIRDFLPKEDGLAGNFDHPMKLRQTVMVKSERQGILEKRFFGPCKVVNVLPYDNILVEYEGKFFRRNISQIKQFRGEVQTSKDSTSILSVSKCNR